MKLVEQRRQGALFFLYPIAISCVNHSGHGLINLTSHPFNFVKSACSHDEIRWLLDEDDLAKKGTVLANNFYERRHELNTLLKLFEKSCKMHEDYCIELNKKRMSNLSTEEIVKLMDNLFVLYQEIWDSGLIGEQLDFALPRIFKSELGRLKIPEKEANDIISLMSSPNEESFSREVEKNLLKIVSEIKKKNLSLKQIFTNRDIKRLINEHIDKYHWSSCNYFAFSGLGLNNVRFLIKQYLSGKESPNKILEEFESQAIKTKKQKHELAKKYHFSDRLLFYFDLAAKTGMLLDKRKKSQMHAFYAGGRLLKELAKRKGVDFDMAKYLFPYEVKDFANERISLEILHKRRKHCYIDYDTNPITVLIGEEAKIAEDNLWKDVDLSTNEVGGVCASPGTVIAKARVITSMKQLHEIQKGEILVTGMTSPEYVPALKKVVGIITDDGGITSHAAIISRELKVPAIVGTKTATRKIKTGDIVELRASHALARVIKTANK